MTKLYGAKTCVKEKEISEDGSTFGSQFEIVNIILGV